jgi:hypothetical protein
MSAKIQLLLVFNPILVAGLAQALGAPAGIIHGIGSVSAFGGLIGMAVSVIRPESPNLAGGQGGSNEPPARAKEKGKQTPGIRSARPGGVSASAGTDDRGAGYLSRIEFTCRQVNLACTVWLKKRGLDMPSNTDLRQLAFRLRNGSTLSNGSEVPARYWRWNWTPTKKARANWTR